MTARTPLVAGNWKMNGSSASNAALVNDIVAGLDTSGHVAICPPFVYLTEIQGLLSGSPVALGSQNASHLDNGAFTGEVSVSMLRDFGCEYVIIGHSERRQFYGETDLRVAEKFAKVVAQGIIPILCVGELLEERESNQTEQVIARQLDAVINLAGIESFHQAVIAYEPVWAIGTGKTATPEQAQDVHAFIRLQLARHDEAVAEKIRILYGGSVKPDNANDLFTMADVDGGLIGGASLKATDFLAICHAMR